MTFFKSKLEKLTIKSYKTADREAIQGPKMFGDDSNFDPIVFKAMFNPESYSLNFQNVYSRKQGINTSGREAKYSLTLPEKINLKLILDGTRVDEYQNLISTRLRGKKEHDVNTRVKHFLEMAGYMDGEIHEPRYLTLLWGDLVFTCRLKSVNINYTLFDKSGIPLRAELDTEFFGDIHLPDRLKKENKNSPDLTHYRVAGTHDQLPLMCKKIYGSSQYYLYVAKANNLNDFRNLQPGQEIYFPPIEK